MLATQDSSHALQTTRDPSIDFENRLQESRRAAEHVVLDGPKGRFSWRDFINVII